MPKKTGYLKRKSNKNNFLKKLKKRSASSKKDFVEGFKKALGRKKR